jgi:hypothetical protein
MLERLALQILHGDEGLSVALINVVDRAVNRPKYLDIACSSA